MAEPTIDEILRDAKAFLAKRTVVDDVNRDAEIARSGRIVERGPDYTYGDVAVDTLNAASIPAMFASGPVGMAAGAYNAIRGLKDFAEKPGLLSGAGVALSAIPALRALKGLRGTRAAAQEAPVIERFVPNRPNPRAGAASADDAATQFTTGVEQYSPNVPNPMAGAAVADDAATQVMNSVERWMPNKSAPVARTERATANLATPEVIAAERVMPGEALPSVAAEGFSLGPVVEAPMSRAKQAAEAMRSMAGQSQGRGWLSKQPETHADWLVADAVPFPRSKTLRSDESFLGLAKELDPRVTELKKAPYPSGAAELMRALRQRARIGAHYGPTEALAALER